MTPVPSTRLAAAREEWRRLRDFARPLAPHDPAPPVPPALPPGETVVLPGRGETFVRRRPGPPGALPVLLLHGWAVTADVNWFGVYETLPDHHPFVAVDLRGHGRGLRPEAPFTFEDCADDNAALLDALGYERAILAGYSMGGPVALHTALRHPDRVAGMVLCATALEWRASPRERLRWRALEVADVLLRLVSRERFVARTLRAAIEVDPSVEELRAWLTGEIRRTTFADVASSRRALAGYDARPWIRRLADIPCASVITTADRLARPSKQRQLARALGADVFEIDHDHDAPLVGREAFGKALVAALESVTPR